MSYESLSADDLIGKIKARKEFIAKVVNFVNDLLGRVGEMIKNEAYSSHHNVRKSLQNFEGFSFDYETGKTQFGGNSLVVWYHSKQVLWFEHQYYSFRITDPDGYKVFIFDSDTKWQNALLALIERGSKEIVEKVQKDKNDIEKREVARRKRLAEKRRLEEEAEKLKI